MSTTLQRIHRGQWTIIQESARNEQRERPRRIEPFLQVPHKALVAGSAVLRSSKQFLVWLYVFHRVWADKSNTVTVANKILNSWGVRRDQKTQALRLLEEAGLIRVQWREKRSPLVTLLADR